jgi:hypothetical protein
MQLFVEQADLLHDSSGPENLWLNKLPPAPPNAPKIDNLPKRVNRTELLSRRLTAFINNSTSRVNQVDRRHLAESSRDRRKSPWQIVIVAVQVGDNVSGALSEALIDGHRLTPIGLADPMMKPPVIVSQDVN